MSIIFYTDLIVKFNWTGDETDDVFATQLIYNGSKSIDGNICFEDCYINS